VTRDIVYTRYSRSGVVLQSDLNPGMDIQVENYDVLKYKLDTNVDEDVFRVDLSRRRGRA
jgi:hypothetical protein